MKKLSTLMITAGLSATLFLQSGCFGSFEATKGLWEWNDNISDSKFVKTLVFYVLAILPGYAIAGFLDVVIFNLIEFWSGSNPIGMHEGQTEEQTIIKDGVTYNMKVTKNTMCVTQMDGKNAGKVEVLRYNEINKTWNLEKDGKTAVVERMKTNSDGTLAAEFVGQNGKIVTVALPSNEQNLALKIQQLKAFRAENVAIAH